MMTDTKTIQTYNLSLEELALSLGMINLPDAAHNMIRLIYPKITENGMTSRLMSATQEPSMRWSQSNSN